MTALADYSFAKNFLPLCRSSKAKVQKALKYLGHVYAGSRQKLTKKSVLDAITWHHYYMNGHTATIQDFLGCTTFQPRTFQPHNSTLEFSTPDFSTMNSSTADFSNTNFQPTRFEKFGSFLLIFID